MHSDVHDLLQYSLFIIYVEFIFAPSLYHVMWSSVSVVCVVKSCK